MNRRQTLMRDIAVLVTLKVVLLISIFALVFAPHHSDGADAASHILGRSTAAPSIR
jgi:hypothetical protein